MAEKIASLEINVKLTGTQNADKKLEALAAGSKALLDALKGLNPQLLTATDRISAFTSAMTSASTSMKGFDTAGKARSLSSFAGALERTATALKSVKQEGEIAKMVLDSVAGKRSVGVGAPRGQSGPSPDAFRARIGVMGQFGPFAGGAIQSVSGAAAAGVAGIAIAATAVEKLGSVLVGLGGASLQAAKEYGQLQALFVAGFGSLQKANSEMDYARSVSDKYGLSLEATARNYAKFAMSTLGTRLEGEATRKMFADLAPVLTVLNSRTRDSELIFKAFTDMLAKGKLMSEEVRKQMGNALPGAFTTVAEAVGLTTAQLMKQMAAGKRFAEQDVPKITEALQKKYGPAAEMLAGSLGVLENRFETAGFMAKKAFGDLITPGVSEALKGFTQFLKETETASKNLKGSGLQEWFTDLGRGVRVASEEMGRFARESSLAAEKAQKKDPNGGFTLSESLPAMAPAFGKFAMASGSQAVARMFLPSSGLGQWRGRAGAEFAQDAEQAALGLLLSEQQWRMPVANTPETSPFRKVPTEPTRPGKDGKAEPDDKLLKKAESERQKQLSYLEQLSEAYTRLTDGPLAKMEQRMDVMLAKASVGTRAVADYLISSMGQVKAEQSATKEFSEGINWNKSNTEMNSVTKATKEYTDEIQKAEKFIDSMMTKDEKWADIQARLAAGFNLSGTSFEKRAQVMAAAKEKFDPETIALNALEKEVNKKQATDDWFNARKARLEELKKTSKVSDKEFNEELERMKRQHSDLYNSFMTDVENFTKNGTGVLLDSLMMGGKAFKEAYGQSATDTLRNLVAEMLKATAQAILLKNVVEPLIGGGGNKGAAGWIAQFAQWLFSPTGAAGTGGAGAGIGGANISTGIGTPAGLMGTSGGSLGEALPTLRMPQAGLSGGVSTSIHINVEAGGKTTVKSGSLTDEAAMSRLTSKITNSVLATVADEFRDGGYLSHVRPN